MGLGAVLMTFRVTMIEFASRALALAKQKYMPSERVLIAIIIWTTHKFCHYLMGRSFIMEIDNEPLEWLESHRPSHTLSQHLEWWSLEL